MAPDKSSVDLVIEKVLPDCPEKLFILNEAPTSPIELTNRLMEKMNWSQCKATTSKLPVAPALDREIKRSLQEKIATAVDTYKIRKGLIFNFDQIPLAFISPGSYTMAPKGGKSPYT